MNAQRYDGMARYAFSFGKHLAWYNFYAFEAMHDRFANIDWRLTPSTGLGYWFADEAAWKATVELALDDQQGRGPADCPEAFHARESHGRGPGAFGAGRGVEA